MLLPNSVIEDKVHLCLNLSAVITCRFQRLFPRHVKSENLRTRDGVGGVLLAAIYPHTRSIIRR
jgi:hypothetical protein